MLNADFQVNPVYYPTVDVVCRFDDLTEKTVRITFDPPSYLDVTAMDDEIAVAGRKATRKFLKAKGIEKPAEFRSVDNPDLADESMIVSRRAEQMHRLKWVASRLKGWDLKERHDPELTQTLNWENLAAAGPVVFLAIQSTVCQYSQGKQCADDKKKSASRPESISSSPTFEELV